MWFKNAQQFWSPLVPGKHVLHFLHSQQVRKCGYGRAALFNHESSEPHWNTCLKKTGHWTDLQLLRHHKALRASNPNGGLWQFTAACPLLFSAFPRLMPVAVLQTKNTTPSVGRGRDIMFCPLPSAWIETD